MKTKQFLTISTRNVDQFTADDFARAVGDEAVRARDLYSDGFIRQIWHRADGQGACLLVEGTSSDEVRKTLHTLPMVQKGMLTVDHVIELAPYKGFGNNI